MSTQSKKVLVAADVIIAFIDRANDKHEQASAFFRFFSQEHYQLFIDILSVNEIYVYLFQSISPSLAKDFLRTLSLSDVNLIFPDDNDIKATWKTLFTYQNNQLTFPTARVATLANRRNIPQVCTLSFFPNLFGIQTFYLPI